MQYLSTKEILRAFQYYSKNDYLNSQQYKLAYISLFGYSPSKLEMEMLFKSPNDVLYKEDFIKIISEKRIDEEKFIKNLFSAIDTHCTGFLTLRDVVRAFHSVSKMIPYHVIAQVFSEFEKRGRITFHDFYKIVKYQYE